MTLALDILEVQPGIIRASCPALPGCVGYGSSPEEAFFEMRAAMKDYFAEVRGIRAQYFGTLPLVRWN